MIRFILVAILALACMQVIGQQRIRMDRNQPPSFEDFQQRIDSIQDPDSVIRETAQFAKVIASRYPDSTLSFAKKVLGFEQLSLIKRRAYSNYILTFYWDRPNPDSALAYSNSALLGFQELDDKSKVLELKILQARFQSRLNNYLLSEEKYLDAIDFLRSNEIGEYNEDGLIDEITNLYIRVGAIDLALDQYRQLLEIESLNPDRRCSIVLKISNAYKRNREIELAKQELLKCDEVEGVRPDLRIAILRGIGDLERVLGNTKEQIRRLESAMMLEAQNNRIGFTTQLFLAKAYNEDLQFEKVDTLINILSKQNIQRVPIPARIDFYLLRAKTDLKSKNLERALLHSEEAIKLAKRLPPTPLLIDAYTLKAEVYSALGNYKEAYDLTKIVNETNNYVKERARISEEAMGKVRFQMSAKNQQLQSITTELGTVKTQNAIITFVLIFIALYVIYRYRVYFLLKEERTRNNIARDLHDDLSATLSSISFFSEAAKREKGTSVSHNQFLKRIDESALEAKEKINDIIWAIDPENDDWNVFITKCKRYAAEMFESKDISYEIDIDNNMELPMDIKARKDIWLIFKEIITNLVRHSEASKAEVIFEKNKNALSIIIKDNGIGFDSKLNHEGNGISNIQKRMPKICKNNNFDLSTKPNEGTKFELKFIF